MIVSLKVVRWLHRKKQKAYKKPITLTWKRNRRSWRYSANMSSIRTICEKIRTRWPVSFNLHSSLSSRNSFPLPRIRVCWKGITKRSHQGYESAQATVFPVTCTYCTIILSNNIHNEKDVEKGGGFGTSTKSTKRTTGNKATEWFKCFTDLSLSEYAFNVIHHHFSMVLIFC